MTDWLAEFQALGALWLHDGNMARPHAELTSGKHSDGFFNGTLVTSRPALVARLLAEPGGLGERLRELGPVDWVFGPAVGAIPWAYGLAAYLDARAGYAEKAGKDPAGREVFSVQRFADQLRPGQRVLVGEDTVTTGGSSLGTIAALRETRVELLEAVAVILNRSGLAALDGPGRSFRLLSCVERRIEVWEPAACPLCRRGSRALRPKQHWAELTGGG